MALADEMRRLTQRFGEDHDGRTAAVAGIRTTVARELSEYRTDRQAEAEAQGQRLRVFMGDLASQVVRARGDTAALLASLGAAREDLSGEQQRKLAGDIGALRQSMDALLDEWNTMRRAMAHEQQQALGRYMFDVCGQVDQLLNDTNQAIAAQHAARQSMAKEQRQHLAEENQSLKDEVKILCTQIGVARQLIIADQADARQVWARYSKLMQQRGARKPQATLQVPKPPAQKKKKAKSPIRIAEPVAPEPPTHVAEPSSNEISASET